METQFIVDEMEFEEEVPDSPVVSEEAIEPEKIEKVKTPVQQQEPQLSTSIEIVESEGITETEVLSPVVQESVSEIQPDQPDEVSEQSLATPKQIRIDTEETTPINQTPQESTQPDQTPDDKEISLQTQEISTVAPEDIPTDVEEVKQVETVTMEKTSPDTTDLVRRSGEEPEQSQESSTILAVTEEMPEQSIGETEIVQQEEVSPDQTDTPMSQHEEIRPKTGATVEDVYETKEETDVFETVVPDLCEINNVTSELSDGNTDVETTNLQPEEITPANEEEAKQVDTVTTKNTSPDTTDLVTEEPEQTQEPSTIMAVTEEMPEQSIGETEIVQQEAVSPDQTDTPVSQHEEIRPSIGATVEDVYETTGETDVLDTVVPDLSEINDVTIELSDNRTDIEKTNLQPEEITPTNVEEVKEVDTVTTENTTSDTTNITIEQPEQSQEPTIILQPEETKHVDESIDGLASVEMHRPEQDQTAVELQEPESIMDEGLTITAESYVPIENVSEKDEVEPASIEPQTEDEMEEVTYSTEITLAPGTEDVISTETTSPKESVHDITLEPQTIEEDHESSTTDVLPTNIEEQEGVKPSGETGVVEEINVDKPAADTAEEMPVDSVEKSQEPTEVQSAPETGPDQELGIVDQVDDEQPEIMEHNITLDQSLPEAPETTIQSLSETEIQLDEAFSTEEINPDTISAPEMIEVQPEEAEQERKTQRVTFEDNVSSPEETQPVSSISEDLVKPTEITREQLSIIEKQAETLVRETLASAMAELTGNVLDQDGLEIEPTVVTFQQTDGEETITKVFTSNKTTTINEDGIVTEQVSTKEVVSTENAVEEQEKRPSLEIIELTDQDEPEEIVREKSSDSTESFEIVEEEQFEIVDAPSPDINTYDLVDEDVPEYTSEVPIVFVHYLLHCTISHLFYSFSPSFIPVWPLHKYGFIISYTFVSHQRYPHVL